MAEEEHFVDKHKVDLIQRVNNISQILDQLLTKKVIQQEIYDKIRAVKPSQEQMRELYSSLNAAACKDILYEILKEKEKWLINDLKKKK